MNTYNNNHFNFRQGSSLLVISIMLIELVYLSICLRGSLKGDTSLLDLFIVFSAAI